MAILLDASLTLDKVMNLDRHALVNCWQSVFDTTPNSTMRTEFLRQAMGWQVQATRYGELDAATRKTLKQGVSNEAVKVGTKLIREWQGGRHQVTVLEKGFEYDGSAYRSLSAIARKITGTAWNGLIFFGVKK